MDVNVAGSFLGITRFFLQKKKWVMEGTGDSPEKRLSTILGEGQDRIVLYGLCHWRQVQLVSKIDLGRLWRLAFGVEKVKATEYCNVRNR